MARGVLIVSIYAYLKEHPEDPKYAYLKTRLYDREYLRSLLKASPWYVSNLFADLQMLVLKRSSLGPSFHLNGCHRWWAQLSFLQKPRKNHSRSQLSFRLLFRMYME